MRSRLASPLAAGALPPLVQAGSAPEDRGVAAKGAGRGHHPILHLLRSTTRTPGNPTPARMAPASASSCSVSTWSFARSGKSALGSSASSSTSTAFDPPAGDPVAGQLKASSHPGQGVVITRISRSSSRLRSLLGHPSASAFQPAQPPSCRHSAWPLQLGDHVAVAVGLPLERLAVVCASRSRASSSPTTASAASSAIVAIEPLGQLLNLCRQSAGFLGQSP
jgi:hypothetical protein